MTSWRMLVILLFLGCAGQAAPGPERPTTSTAPATGLITVISSHDFATTVARLQTAITGKGLRVFATIDHAANAKAAGLALPATTLVIFGKPQVGTVLMNTSRSVAIDLPQKMLVYERDGKVYITYNDPRYLETRHGLAARAAILGKVRGLLAWLADQAARGPTNK